MRRAAPERTALRRGGRRDVSAFPLRRNLAACRTLRSGDEMREVAICPILPSRRVRLHRDGPLVVIEREAGTPLNGGDDLFVGRLDAIPISIARQVVGAVDDFVMASHLEPPYMGNADLHIISHPNVEVNSFFPIAEDASKGDVVRPQTWWEPAGETPSLSSHSPP